MKITAVTPFVVDPGYGKNWLFVKVETSDGLHGWGECYTQADRDQSIVAHVKQLGRYLVDEIQERLKRGPVTFRLRAQLAVAGDPTKDPTKPWPSDRKVIDLGVLTIDKTATNSAEAEKKLLYMPNQLTDGIEESDDPMIGIRSGAYAVSFSRRNP